MKFLIHTYGCQMNVRDAETVSLLLEAVGHVQVGSEAEADAVIINTCSVRGKAEDKALGKAGLLCAEKRNRPLIVGVMGCMAQRLGEAIFTTVRGLDFIVGSRRHGSVPQLLARVAAGETQIAELGGAGDVTDIPHVHSDGAHAAFVTILLGCNRRCAYCIVPDVRGPEHSRPAAEIVAEVRQLAARGVREVTLLGQSVMNYGRANAVEFDAPAPSAFSEPLPRLLEAVASVPGIRRIRFTSGHPSGCTDELVRAVRDIPKVCAHLHLPVQSGSDRILALMRRGYVRVDYLDAIARLRAARPGFAITSDVIVGFPGETEEDFEATRSLMDEAGFENTFIFKYSPRPGTPAAALPETVTAEEKMRRNQLLLADQDRRGQAINEARIGETVEVLADGPSLRNASRWAGRTSGNMIVIFENRADARVVPGDLVSVTITRAKPQTLYGEMG
jgi:tRNA-2-methylthio-N6-dimethylallyladenosine synthase